MDNMPMPQDDSMNKDIMVSADALGQDAKSLKVGDTVEMTVSNIQGNMISLSPAASDESEEDTNPETMPLDKLEASLPKAERE